MRDYEMMVVLGASGEEASADAATERVKTMLTARGAEVASLDSWGRRRLAYPIGHHKDGYYALARFKMDPAQADELDRALKLSEEVIRHLLIRLDER